MGRKTFDCVAFKTEAQARIGAETAGLTPAEEVAWFARQAERGSLGKWWKQVRSAAKAQHAIAEPPEGYNSCSRPPPNDE